MEQIKLKATVREDKGKEAAKRLRQTGHVPAVVYHRGEDPVPVAVSGKEIMQIMRNAGGENLLINLSIEGAKKTSAASGERSRTSNMRIVIVKEVQHDPVKRNILHIDFNEISLTEKIIVEVPVVALGEPVGVKQDGGILDHPLRELKVQCLPADIPQHIDVDVSGLALNGAIHVKDLKLSAALKVLNDPEALLFQVKLPVEEKVEETPAEPQEVEVIREKKEEEGAAPAEKAKEEPKAEKKG
ncbi:MAG: 50S ribosomal protein L25 [Candidatus Omnitrophica bacterium]|nr:50S ribosomal protein L25 [Candidatus Omnitrophota bacterium]